MTIQPPPAEKFPDQTLAPTDPAVGDMNLTRPVHFAAYFGATECLKLLLQHLADPLLPDKGGRSCLHWAAGYANNYSFLIIFRTGRLDVVQCILDTAREIDVNTMDRNRRTALDWAIEGSHNRVEDVKPFYVGCELLTTSVAPRLRRKARMGCG